MKSKLQRETEYGFWVGFHSWYELRISLIWEF